MKYSRLMLGISFCCAALIACDTSAPADPMVHKQDVPATTVQSQQKGIPSLSSLSQHANPTAHASVFPVDNGGWGYQVLINNRPYIKQTFIPAIQGKQAFKTQLDAQKIGDWVADQIKQGKQFSVSTHLMDSLGVKY